MHRCTLISEDYLNQHHGGVARLRRREPSEVVESLRVVRACDDATKPYMNDSVSAAVVEEGYTLAFEMIYLRRHNDSG